MTSRGAIAEAGPALVVTGHDDALDLWSALLAHYLARREVRTTTWGQFYPETVLADVFAVAGLFEDRLRGAPSDQLGLADTRKRWNEYRETLRQHAAGRRLHETYTDNARFWRSATRRLALDLSTGAALPEKAEIVLDALKTSVGSLDGALDAGERLLGRAADEIGDALTSIGSGAKKVVKGGVEGVGDAVIKPLVDAVGKPLLIGAAVVGGLLIVPKLLDGGNRHG